MRLGRQGCWLRSARVKLSVLFLSRLGLVALLPCFEPVLEGLRGLGEGSRLWAVVGEKEGRETVGAEMPKENGGGRREECLDICPAWAGNLRLPTVQ